MTQTISTYNYFDFKATPCRCGKNCCKGNSKQLPRTNHTLQPTALQLDTRDYLIWLFNQLPVVDGPFGAMLYEVLNCFFHVFGSWPIAIVGFLIDVKALLESGASNGRIALEVLRAAVGNFGGTTFCSCVTPTLVHLACLYHFESNGYRDAKRALEHYASGGGRDYNIDIARLITEDQGVKEAIESKIRTQGTDTGGLLYSDGSQLQQSSFRNTNWLYTLGNVDEIRFQVVNRATSGTSTVELTLRDPYEWHPDVGRSVPCLHTAMENLKHYGAHDFTQVGSPTLVQLNI